MDQGPLQIVVAIQEGQKGQWETGYAHRLQGTKLSLRWIYPRGDKGFPI